MKVKNIQVRIEDEETSWDNIRKVFARIDEGKPIPFERSLVFRSVELMRRFITTERLRMLTVIKHQKPQSIYALAKLLERDRKSVTKDLNVLVDLGFVELIKSRSEGNRVIVTPRVEYDRIDIRVPV